jgi:hypothetical protein
MTRVSFASITRLIGRGLMAGSVVCLGLFAYCGYVQYSFWTRAQALPATVTSVYRLPVDDQRGNAGHRMTVTFADAGGRAHVVSMSGLYRGEPGDAGKALTVYYNPSHPIRIALSSPRNWAGPAVYGAAAIGLLLSGWSAFRAARRWTPPLPLAPAQGVA